MAKENYWAGEVCTLLSVVSYSDLYKVFVA